VHGYSVARKLGITRLVCPPSPGIASAWGLLVAPARVDRVTTIGFRLESDPLAGFEAAFRQLEDEARAVVAATGLPLAGLRVDRLGDGRCVGQGFDLVVPLPPGPYADDATARPALAAAFERGYREKFGRAPPAVPLEFINARVSVRVAVSGGQIADLAGAAGEAPSGTIKGQRRAWFAEAGGFVDATVYDRDGLAANTAIAGPALIEDSGSTLVIGPAATAQVMPSGSIVVELRGSE
jgi:N-methylhydantoinase A